MGTKYIIDASVVVKWFALENEENIEEATRLFNDIKLQLIIPLSVDYLFVEVINVLCSGRKFKKDKLLEAIAILYNLQFQTSPITRNLLEQAVQMTLKYNQTLYDALYLSLAKRENTKLITADKALLKVKAFTLPLSDYK